MQEEKTAENKANYIDGGNFKARIGNTTYLVGVFFNKAKKVTIEDRTSWKVVSMMPARAPPMPAM